MPIAPCFLANFIHLLLSQTCLGLLILYLVDTAAHTLKTDFYNVSVFQPNLRLAAHTDALYLRSGEDQVARQQGSALTQDTNGLGNSEDHVSCVAVLDSLAIDLSHDS
ncbi:hypothetical protein KCU74_g19, partial [Aureobasidium melanogenum]